MPEFKPQPPINSESTTAVVGVVNFTPQDQCRVLPSYSSMSYTVGNKQPEGLPSQPLSAGSIRVINSVLGARVPEEAILRDTNGDI